MIAVAWFQTILSWFGWVVAEIYRYIPNYGITIILLTLAIRIILLPLAVKQIRSMHAMQQIQPKIKQIQQKYKGNRERMNQEMMALYKEHGYNPLSGCMPMVLQFPVLICLYAVLVVPKGIPHLEPPAPPELRTAIVEQQSGIHFLGMNLTCTAWEAGQGEIKNPPGTKQDYGLKSRSCGSSRFPDAIPYYALALFMVGTQYYQQRQMQRANPAMDRQQQMLTQFMPLLFGVWGFIFPAGLVVYWTTTNLVQIGQQHFMLPRKGEAPPVEEAKQPKGKVSEGGRAAKDNGGGRSSKATQPRSGGSQGRRKGQRGGVVPRARSGEGVRKPVAGRPRPDGGSKGSGDARNRKKRP